MKIFTKRTCWVFLLSLYPIFKCTVMQIEEALINDRLCVSTVFRKFRIPSIYTNLPAKFVKSKK